MNDLSHKGYFGIGIDHPTTAHNMGTLWRSAAILGASFIFTIDKQYKEQSTDVLQSWKYIPLYNYKDFDHFYGSMPRDCFLVGVEMLEKSTPIVAYEHPERCIYLLGAENNGLSAPALKRCHHYVQLPGNQSLNVASAGSIVMYDRLSKGHVRHQQV
jgi:tRNA G18 (ribose-2'-O)-methylase SpoU